MISEKPQEEKHLLFVTGTRADYGKLEPLALAAAESGFRVTFFVTGMHMMLRYGLTKEEVHREESFEVIEFLNQSDGDPQELILAKTVIGFSDYLSEIKPDMVVIHGDRVEALACSLVCSMSYVLCVHVEGGEVSGTIDEIFRHCNSKLASVHLVSSSEARKRVLQLGESEQSVYVIGSPELDIHLKPSGLTIEQVRRRYDIDAENYGICVFHPVTSEQENIGKQAELLFDALVTSGHYFIVILPNNDPGSHQINRVIEQLPQTRFRVLPSMRFNYFSELIKNASLFVGNSSAGVREAPFMGIPSLDIGTRQSNRALADSVLHCDGTDASEIQNLIFQNWGKRCDPHAGYGSGNAAQQFVELLRKPSFWIRPKQKYFSESGILENAE